VDSVKKNLTNRRGYLKFGGSVILLSGLGLLGRDGHRTKTNPNEKILFDFFIKLTNESNRALNRASLKPNSNKGLEFDKKDYDKLAKELLSDYSRLFKVNFHPEIQSSPEVHKIIDSLQKHGISAESFRSMIEPDRDIILKDLFNFARQEEKFYTQSLDQNLEPQSKSFLLRFAKYYTVFINNDNYQH
jgi:hypothetical protein